MHDVAVRHPRSAGLVTDILRYGGKCSERITLDTYPFPMSSSVRSLNARRVSEN